MIVERLSLEKACSSIPVSCRGVYILLLRVERGENVRVGSLGDLWFEEGVYAYIGSGKGPGGVRARLCRHIHGCGRKRWHIDYLRTIATPIGYSTCCDPARSEPDLYSIMESCLKPVHKGFGSSDDQRAYSHLFHCPGGTEECISRIGSCLEGDPCLGERLVLLA